MWELAFNLMSLTIEKKSVTYPQIVNRKFKTFS